MAEETPETTEAAAEEKKPAGKIPMIGGIVAGLALGAGVGLFILGPKLAPASPSHATAKAKEEHKENEKEGEKGKSEASPVYQLDNMVLNPSGSNGVRFLLVSVALEVKDEATLTMIKGHDAEMRDMILRLFGAKTAEQLTEASAREPLRGEVIAAFNKLFPAGTIKKVYFPQFVIQ
jgi:flagellar FliL protein